MGQIGRNAGIDFFSSFGPISLTVDSIGGSSAANVHTAELLANAATTLNTANTIVKRDASGNFAAGTITSNLIGTVTGSVNNFSGSLDGDVTGTQLATAISSSTVISKVLTGYVSGAGVITSSDTVLTAIQKLNGNITAVSGGAITALTGDVTASGPGAVVSTVAFVAASTAANVHAAELLANAATDTNTASAIVKRDISGNFSAGTITAALSGNASTATLASTVTTNANLTGDITSSGNSTTYSGTVPLNRGGTGQTTKAQAFDALNPMTTGGDLIYGGASGTGTRLPNGTAGQLLQSNGTTLAPTWVPAPITSPLTIKGDIYTYSAADARLAVGTDGQVLTADSLAATGNKWATPTTGTVTSISQTVPAFLSISGSPITSAGTLAIGLSGTALPVPNGGTGTTTSTGTGNVVLSDSPTLVTPSLGTPSALVGTNISGTASGLTAGSVTTNANLTGDVTSVGNTTTLTNAPVIAKVLTGYTSGAGTIAAADSILEAIQKLNGNDATNANLTGPITSTGNATAIASQTGTGTKFVVDTSPTLVTPTLGVAVATSINKVIVTAPATNSTLTIAEGATLSAPSSATVSGTNTGDISLAAVGSAPSANGASLSNQVLTLQPADATHPGSLLAADWVTFNAKQAAGNYITALTGDVTASGPGSSAATVAFVAASTAANVHAAELLANAATDANTASTIVKRDISGNFSAGTITAALTGNASTATLASTVTTNANLTGDVTSVGNTTTLTNAPVIAKVLTGYTSGAGAVVATDSILEAIQKLNGNDATNANLTGDVTSVGNATTITAGVVTNTMLAGSIEDSKLNTISTAGKVSNSATTATSANTASAIVARDGSGSFTAGTITADIDKAAGTLSIGVNATTLNIGNVGSTVNILGTLLYENVTQLQVTDPLITLNKGGAVGSAAASGFELEENAIITGSVKSSADRNSWELKAPNTAGITTITAGVGGILLNQSSHDPVTLAAVGSAPDANGATLSGQVLTLQPADATHPGSLLAADWVTFNAKQPAGNYITALTGDVTASGPGSSAATVAFVAASSAANVHSAELLANAATDANTASTIVKRDISGNFSAGTISAALTGNASTATLASTVTTNANLTGVITSVGNATSIASQTGSGTKFVVDTSPTLVTPVLGVAAATSVNKVIVTAPATSSTLTIADGATLSAPSSATVSGTNTGDITVSSFGSTPDANGATLTGQALALQPADATHPGSITTGTQTIAGQKTFSTGITGNLTGNASTVTTNANLTGDVTSVGNATTSNSLRNMMSTALISNVALSINADPAKFNVGAFTARYVDNYTDPLNPTYSIVAYAGSTANTLTNLATQDATYISINSAGTILQTVNPPTPAQQRQYVQLGGFVHSNRTSIAQAITLITVPGIDIPAAISDFSLSVGPVNRFGNVISGNATNGLKLNKSAGETFQTGINFTNSFQNPNVTTDIATVAANFFYSWRDGSGNYTVIITDTVVPGKYDNNTTGGTTSPNGILNTNKWQLLRVSRSQGSNVLAIETGQIVYDSLSEAIANRSTATSVNPAIADLQFRGWVAIRGGATDIKLAGDALYIDAGKFSVSSAGGAAGSSTTTLQGSYNNSITPEIVTDSTRSALTIQRGSAADTDAILEGRNGATTVTSSITGAGVISGLSLASTVATGTAPLVVASTTVVANLKAATSGNSDTVTTNANLTGPITSTGNATAVANLAITNAMIAATTIDLAAKVTGVLPFANGGTGQATRAAAMGGLLPSQAGATGQFLQSIGSVGADPVWSGVSASATPAASTIAEWDANVNLSANNLIDGYTTTVTAAGTTTLVVGSTSQQYFTGTTTQTVLLPVTSTLVLGQQFVITNLSTGIVTVQSSGANTIQAMIQNTQLVCTVIAVTGTGVASWSAVYSVNQVTAIVNPTVQKFLSGSGNYTTPAGCQYIRVRMVGGGGGGGGAGTSGNTDGGTGGTTTFGSSLLTALGGNSTSTSGGAGGLGGTTTVAAGPIGIGFTGSQGNAASRAGAQTQYMVGGSGGTSPFGGAGGGTLSAGGGSAVANTGSGGGGGATDSTSWSIPAGGGGAGGFIDVIVFPTAGQVYAYAVGAAGTAGGAGTSGGGGGTGGSGFIEVTEYYSNLAVGTTTTVAAGTFLAGPTSGSAAAPTFRALQIPVVQTFTATGTYTPTTGMLYCIVRLVGGGGGGGGGYNDAGLAGAGGGGGGGGGYSSKVISAATIGASQSVTIGSAAGGGATGATGTTGATVSLGALISATGGVGGVGGTGISTSGGGGAGGVGSSGNTNSTGGGGGSGGTGISGVHAGSTGSGGSSYFGGGAPGLRSALNGSVGGAGQVYGGGGAGGSNNATGGAGALGYVEITEYFQ